jgi:acetolactate synthase I/II/III large subunit
VSKVPGPGLRDDGRTTVNGATALLRTVARLGVDVCFANPGTTELPLVTAADGEHRVRPVLTLFEGVATGAADGYARIAGRPAMTLLHLGPGLANGAASLHNARRSGSPVLTVVGDHATWHRAYDPPLASDVAGLAAPVSVWVRETARVGSLPGDVVDGVHAATAVPGPATLVVPADVQAAEVPADAEGRAAAAAGTTGDGPTGALPSAGPGTAGTPTRPPEVDEDAVAACARALRGPAPAALLLGGDGTSAAGLRAAARVEAATGCAVVLERFPTRLERGGGLPAYDKLAYFPEAASAALPAGGALVLAGARSPVTFFGYPRVPSSEVPVGTTVTTLAGPHDGTAALEALAAQVAPAHGATRAARSPAEPAGRGLPSTPTGTLDPAALVAAVAATQPEGAVVVDEGLTSTATYLQASAHVPWHTYLANAGGAIGHGMPLATGAALAAPDRPVLTLQADGSGMYTPQALWTQAREGLDVTTVVCANGAYRILQAEMRRAGDAAGPASGPLTDLGNPSLGWVSLAAGAGVPARRAETAEDLVAALREALAEPGPHLVEAVLDT